MDILIAGVDEAGRGPLAGPVVAAAVILSKRYCLPGLTDSKLLSQKKREFLDKEIKHQALAWSIGWANVYEIDSINILKASLLAMQRALNGLKITPTKVLVDGNQKPKIAIECETIIAGDSKIAAISAASIIAKVARDNEMILLDKKYPKYGFAQHKGYATKRHRMALTEFGPCKIHRTSFAPVKALLDKETSNEI